MVPLDHPPADPIGSGRSAPSRGWWSSLASRGERELHPVEAAGEVSFDLDEDDLWFGSVISQVERKLTGLDEEAVPEVVAAVLHGLAPTGLVVLDQHLRPWPDQEGALDRILADWQRSVEEPGFDGPWLARLPGS